MRKRCHFCGRKKLTYIGAIRLMDRLVLVYQCKRKPCRMLKIEDPALVQRT